MKNRFGIKVMLFMLLLALGFAFAQSGSGSGNSLVQVDLQDPMKTQCGKTGNVIDFTCEIMQALLTLGPYVAVLSLVVAGIIYGYSNVFVTADQRGRYHTLAMNIVVGALILAAICGAAGILTSKGLSLLKT